MTDPGRSEGARYDHESRRQWLNGEGNAVPTESAMWWLMDEEDET